MAFGASYNDQYHQDEGDVSSILDTRTSATATRAWEEQQQQQPHLHPSTHGLLLRTTSATRRLQAQSSSTTTTNTTMNNNTNNGGEGVAHDFVAFGMFLLLALCSVLLTCFIHRRRRSFEERLAAQQHDTTTNTVVHTWQSHGYFRIVNEMVLVERARLLRAELSDTTMIVTAGDLAKQHDNDTADNKNHNTIQGQVVVDCNDTLCDVEMGAEPRRVSAAVAAAGAVQDEDMDDDDENCWLVRLPSLSLPQQQKQKQEEQLPNPMTTGVSVHDNDDAAVGQHSAATTATTVVNGDRWVPGVCTVCFRLYQVGDQLTWSKRQACCHAFHTECIIPWLAKKELPECPVCRQVFCDPQQVFYPIAAATKVIMNMPSPFQTTTSSSSSTSGSSSTTSSPELITDQTLEPSEATTTPLRDGETEGTSATTTTETSIVAPLECPPIAAQVEHSNIQQNHDSSIRLESPGGEHPQTTTALTEEQQQ